MSGRIEDLYKVQRKDAAKAAEILNDAFQDDPVWQALFAEGCTREQMQASFEAPVVYCLKFGEVWATSSGLEGIAAWVPGRYAHMSIWRTIQSGAFRAGMRMGAALARSMGTVFAPIERDRAKHMKGRAFIYLMILGVSPASQGQGLGRKLLRALIEKSDLEGLPIYLETETEKNVSMYERFGFRVVKEIALPVIHLPMWEMVKEPRT